MIGNDIVDLQLAKTQSNWQRKGFLEKQFTIEEQKIIKTSSNPFLQVWLFWAMKEAAYKCYVQEFKKQFFAPFKISCKTINNVSGIAKIKSQKYIIKYCISDKYVYTLARKEDLKKMSSEIVFIKNNRDKTKIISKKLLSRFDENTMLKKNGMGVPYLYKNESVLPFSISTTHHGNYGAFAITEL